MTKRAGFGFVIATVAGLGFGCERPALDAGASTGSIVVSSLAAAPGDEVKSFRIDVARAGTVTLVDSESVSAAGGMGESSFVLAPGDYQVTATAVDAAGAAVSSCDPASGPALVSRGRTTELALVVRCHGGGRGGLDVTVGVNHEPEFTGVSYSPSKTVAACAPATVTVAATDSDGDAITYQFGVVAAPAGAQVGADYVLGAVGGVGSSATFRASATGDYSVEARACDARGCATLRLPVHVTPGAASCAVSCDEGNPCTTDSASAEGICAHAQVADGTLCVGGNLRVKLLGFNDFHGQLETGKLVAGRPVGGAAILASYLQSAQAAMPEQTIIVHAGDHVGASPPASALLQDEPSISVLNLLANGACSTTDKLNPACNLVGTLGNHEFDEGRGELLRLLGGGNYAAGPFLEDPYGGARFPYVCANVIDEVTNHPILPPYVIKTIKGVRIAFVGAVLKDTPTVVTPTGVAGLRFLDEADAINAVIPEIHAAGVHAIVVTIHQGGTQTSFTGPTPATPGTLVGADIQRILSHLDPDVDVVVSGHSHAFTNTFVPNAAGGLVLVTQAFSASTAYADIDLTINPTTGDVVTKTAQIVTTFGDAGPGLTPHPAIAAIVTAAQARVAPLVQEVVGTATVALTQTQNAAGESTMGDLIADAQRAAMETDLAFMNPGGIRANLDAGPITWGELFTVQPFGNSLVRMNLTGAQVYAVLEQQWAGQPFARIMQISGFDYTWDPARPVGSRVVEVRRNGTPIGMAEVFSATCNNFMSTGGDNLFTFVAGTNKVGGPIDLDALVDYVEAHTPVAAPAGARINVP